MLSATFDDRGGEANDPAFSMDLNSSKAIFRSPEIFRGNCYTSQGDPDSSFPLWLQDLRLLDDATLIGTLESVVVWERIDPVYHFALSAVASNQ